MGGVGVARLCALLWLSAAVLSVFMAPASADAATPSWSFEPSSWDFGLRMPEEGPSEPKTFELANTGDVTLTPALISVSGAEGAGFKLAGDTCQVPLAPGDRCTVGVTFDPPDGGAKRGTLTVEAFDPGVAPASAQLSGSAGEPRVEFDPAVIDFGTISAGTPVGPSRTLTVTNTGSAALTIRETGFAEASGSLSMPNFYLGSDGCAAKTLAPRDSCMITYQFSPRAPGSYRGMVSIFDDAAASPQTVELLGTAVPTIVPPGPAPLRPAAAQLIRRPPRRTKARYATFAFSGDASTARFQCRLGGGPLVDWCRSPVRYRGLKPGNHRFSYRAVGGDGLPGPVSTYRWRILP